LARVHGGAQVVEAEIVQHHHVGAMLQGVFQLVHAIDLDLDLHEVSGEGAGAATASPTRRRRRRGCP
jgi:hypothetical protein